MALRVKVTLRKYKSNKNRTLGDSFDISLCLKLNALENLVCFDRKQCVFAKFFAQIGKKCFFKLSSAALKNENFRTANILCVVFRSNYVAKISEVINDNSTEGRIALDRATLDGALCLKH